MGLKKPGRVTGRVGRRIPGSEGIDGRDGMKGIDGSDGMKGIDGSDGMEGIKGTDGRRL